MKTFTENLHSAKRTEWLRRIIEIRDADHQAGDQVSLSFGDLPVSRIQPEHIVSLACLVESLTSKKVNVSIFLNEECGKYFSSTLKLSEYWKGGQDYAPAEHETVLNLWHVKADRTEEHARRTTQYLKNSFFKNKDLSAVTLSLLEAYYNINDHSKFEGNAFSMLSFDEETEVLNVAVCDFGIGIATSVKNYDSSIENDKEALKKAVEANFTVQSTEHNAGMGLYNIKSVCTDKDTLWIISNGAALGITSTNERAIDMGFDFRGCLLTYSISLSHFEDEETLEDFNW